MDNAKESKVKSEIILKVEDVGVEDISNPESQEPELTNVKREIEEFKLEIEEMMIVHKEEKDDDLTETRIGCYKMASQEEITRAACNIDNYQRYCKGNLEKDKDLSLIGYKDPPQVNMFKSKHKNGLQAHMLVHQDSSQISIFKCNQCSFQSKHKGNFQRHLLTHKCPSQISMHKCNQCSYESKHKANIIHHMRLHKDPSQISMFKCNQCSFQSKTKENLKRHQLVHDDPSQINMFKCNDCSYQSKHRLALRKHLLVHKDPSLITMYKCNQCSFQSKHKKSLQCHMLFQHKDTSEKEMDKSDESNSQSK